MKKIEENISIKEIIDELLETNIFKKITERNDEKFAHKLAVWLVRYILVISSMNESLKIELEDILLSLHTVDDQIFSNSQSRSVKTHSVEHIFQQMNQ